MQGFDSIEGFYNKNRSKPLLVDGNDCVIYVEFRHSFPDQFFVWTSKPHQYFIKKEGAKEIWTIRVDTVLCVMKSGNVQNVTQKCLSGFGPAGLEGVMGAVINVYGSTNGVPNQRFSPSIDSKMFPSDYFNKARNSVSI